MFLTIGKDGPGVRRRESCYLRATASDFSLDRRSLIRIGIAAIPLLIHGGTAFSEVAPSEVVPTPDPAEEQVS